MEISWLQRGSGDKYDYVNRFSPIHDSCSDMIAETDAEKAEI